MQNNREIKRLMYFWDDSVFRVRLIFVSKVVNQSLNAVGTDNISFTTICWLPKSRPLLPSLCTKLAVLTTEALVGCEKCISC